MARKMEVAIFGVGAMGCLLGWRLSPLAEVTLYGSRGSSLVPRLQREPLVVWEGSTQHRVRLRAAYRGDARPTAGEAVVGFGGAECLAVVYNEFMSEYPRGRKLGVRTRSYTYTAC